MNSFTDGFFWIIGVFIGAVFVFVLIMLIFYYGLQSGIIQDTAKESLKRAIGIY